MLAKGRLLGIQFLTLMEDGLYFSIAAQANAFARRLRKAFQVRQCPFLYDSPTNQQFPILTQAQNDFLAERYSFQLWEKVGENQVGVRFCTSWATREEDVAALEQSIYAMPDAL